MKEVCVSVIVPFYNSEKYLPTCIECLNNQTLKNIEVILINDGSTDKGANVARRLISSYENMYLIDQTNAGPGASRNKGMKLAKGKYIYFLDVDDFIVSDALEKAVIAAHNSNVDIVIFNSVNVTEETTYIKSITEIPKENISEGLYSHRDIIAGQVLKGKEYVADALVKKNGFATVVWVNLYRTSFLKNNNFKFEAIIHEDNVFSIETFMASNRLLYIDETMHCRRVVPTSIMNQKKTEKHVIGAFQAMKHASELSKKYRADTILKHALHNWNLINVGMAYYELRLCSKDVQKKYKCNLVGHIAVNLWLYNPQILLKTIFM